METESHATQMPHEHSSALRDAIQSTDMGVRLKLETNNRVTPGGHWQDVRHLTFSSDSGMTYSPGDILEIQPRNATEAVEQMLSLMGWLEIADAKVYFTKNKAYAMTPTPPKPCLPLGDHSKTLTLRRILSQLVDINAIPRRSFFRCIAHFSDDEFQQDRLHEFADPDLTDELFDYTTRPRRSILEVLQEFDSVRIPWQWVFEIFPPMRPRLFSIASGGESKSDSQGQARFELLVAIVKYKTVIRKLRRGTCTRYLEGLRTGDELDAVLVRGSLGIQRKHCHIPLVLVGPGTGIAPIRSLLWEKHLWQYQYSHSLSNGRDATTPQPSGRLALFFGCRNKTADFFFQDEWTDLEKDLPLSMFLAFSRDQQRKVYVQDLFREHKDVVFDLLYLQKGIICICGSSGKMPDAIRETLMDIFQDRLACSRAEAQAELQAMEKSGRYKQETW